MIVENCKLIYVFIYVCVCFYFYFYYFFSQRLEVFNNAPHHTHLPPPLPRRPLPDFGFRYSLLKVLLAGRKLVTSTWLAG